MHTQHSKQQCHDAAWHTNTNHTSGMPAANTTVAPGAHRVTLQLAYCCTCPGPINMLITLFTPLAWLLQHTCCISIHQMVLIASRSSPPASCCAAAPPLIKLITHYHCCCITPDSRGAQYFLLFPTQSCCWCCTFKYQCRHTASPHAQLTRLWHSSCSPCHAVSFIAHAVVLHLCWCGLVPAEAAHAVVQHRVMAGVCSADDAQSSRADNGT